MNVIEFYFDRGASFAVTVRLPSGKVGASTMLLSLNAHGEQVKPTEEEKSDLFCKALAAAMECQEIEGSPPNGHG